MSHSVCTQCGHVMLTEELRTSERCLCPKCGCKYFTMTFHVTQEFLPNNTTRIKQRDPYHKSDKKLRREHFLGMETNSQGRLMVKERLIDKDANIYYEFVMDSQTGEVVRKCHESLTDHVNRGSNKKIDKEDT